MAETALRQTLAGKPSLEVQRRIEQLLDKARPLSPERLRLSRAVEVLELIGTAEAKQLFKQLTTGSEHARLTREAKASLDRLNQRTFGKR